MEGRFLSSDFLESLHMTGPISAVWGFFSQVANLEFPAARVRDKVSETILPSHGYTPAPPPLDHGYLA